MTIIYFLLILGIIITVHEFGHMVIAKLFNVYVNEFAIGFGPTIWSKQGKETKYSLRAIPLGGFTGMVEAEETPLEFDENGNPTKILKVNKDRTFYGVSGIKRILVLLAGPFFNMILAWVVYIAIFQINGYTYEEPKAIIASVMEASPAEEAGLQANDLITKMVFSDGSIVEPKLFSDISIGNRGNGPIQITVLRSGSEITVNLTPKYNEEEGRYLIGITAPDMELRKINFIQAIPEGFKYANNVLKLTFESILGLFNGSSGMESLGGTIAIYKYTEEAASYGFVSLMSLMGALSVSVGIMNLVPIPIFDGGKIVLTLIEMIIGRRLNEKAENFLTMIGLGLVLLLFLFVTYQDIIKLF